MKKLISIFVVSIMILCVNGNSYAGGDENNSSALGIGVGIGEGGDAESSSNSEASAGAIAGAMAGAVSGAGVIADVEGKQDVNISEEKKVYNSTLNFQSSQGKDESGVSSPFGGILNSEPSIDEKLGKKGPIVMGYEEMGLLGTDKKKGKREAAKDMLEFNADIRTKKNRATLIFFPDTGNPIINLVAGTKSIWPSPDPQAKAVKSFNRINTLDSQILEAEFDFQDAKTEVTKSQLNKKIAAKRKSLEREEMRLDLYNKQSVRIIEIK